MFVRFWGLTVVLLLAGFAVAWMFVEPAPPAHAVIAAGRADGNYYAVAQRYARMFADNGIRLDVKTTNGSVENYQLLLNPQSDVDLAIVQGGTLPDGAHPGLEAIVSIYFEPLWIFTRGATPIDRLDALRGKKIAIGADGSGSRALAIKLLSAYGVTDGADGTQFLPLGGAESTAGLATGAVDAVMLVASPKSATVKELLARTDCTLMSVRQAPAISKNFPFLSAVTLHEGSIDLQQNLPRQTITLVAPAAMIVTRKTTHEGIALLATQAAAKEHNQAELVSEAGDFPTTKYLELPVAAVAQHYLKNGPGLLNRRFPFWLASLIERMAILLVPLLTLLIPIIRFAPPIYAWRVRAKIYRWYKELRQIDAEIALKPGPEQRKTLLQRIDTVSHDVREVSVPLSYMRELYDLREHVDLLQRRIESPGETVR